MIDLSAGWIAAAAGGELAAGAPEAAGPERAVIDSRDAGAGDLFAGLPGASADGGEFAPAALEAGVWGVLVGPAHRDAALRAVEGAVGGSACASAAVIVAPEPLLALQRLATAWRRELGAKVIGVTGSTGKTSTKDILSALLGARMPVHASRENWNTEIGLPLTILEARRGVEALVLEMAMRGEGQIAELVAVAEPDAGVIVNVGPVHLELLGTVERVAAAKAELIRDLRGRGRLRGAGERAAAGAASARGARHLDVRARRPGAAALDGGRARRDRGARRADRARAVLPRAAQPAEHAGRGSRGARPRPAGRRGGRRALLLAARRGGGAAGRRGGRE